MLLIPAAILAAIVALALLVEDFIVWKKGGDSLIGEILGSWEEFAEKSDFKLNPDDFHVKMVIEGVLANEKICGLKLCPCRLRDGSRERDLQIICPCNFKAQETWNTKGECWCGLFVKKS